MSRCVRNPGEYDRLITIERLKPNQAQDVAGHYRESLDSSWETYAKAYAKITTKGGREFWKINRVEDTVDTVFHCLYSKEMDTVTTKMRVRYRDKVYNILSAINVDLSDQEIEIQSRS